MAKKKQVIDKSVRLETVEEAIARGVKVERLPSSEEMRQQKIEAGEIVDRPVRTVKGVVASAIDIKGLGEAIDFYGEKIRRKKKVKTPDFSQVDKDQIPKSLHYIFKDSTEKAKPETDSNK